MFSLELLVTIIDKHMEKLKALPGKAASIEGKSVKIAPYKPIPYTFSCNS